MRHAAILTLVLTATAAIATPPPPPPPPDPPVKKVEPPTEKVTIGKETFKLEIAADDAARAKGLSKRAEIKPDGGMIFIYADAAERAFWMVDCLVDIDVVYLDGKGKIISRYAMKKEPLQRPDETRLEYELRLKDYPSRGKAQFILEFKAGTIQRLRFRPGQTIELDYERLAKLAKEKADDDGDGDGGGGGTGGSGG